MYAKYMLMYVWLNMYWLNLCSRKIRKNEVKLGNIFLYLKDIFLRLSQPSEILLSFTRYRTLPPQKSETFFFQDQDIIVVVEHEILCRNKI